jgi:hypothetical protein
MYSLNFLDHIFQYFGKNFCERYSDEEGPLALESFFAIFYSVFHELYTTQLGSMVNHNHIFLSLPS